jgi:hypothetical protein
MEVHQSSKFLTVPDMLKLFLCDIFKSVLKMKMIECTRHEIYLR